MYHKHLLIISAFSLLVMTTQAQTKEIGGWLFLSHTQKISSKFDLLADLQLRTADQYTYWKNLLSRTALSYNLSDKHSVALGYAYLGEWEKSEIGKEYTREHRIYQQYQYSFKHRNKEFTLRGRFEQRFIKEEDIKFSQRARVFASIQAPLIANDDFSSGLYIKFQDEIFLNVQNRDQVNGSVLDQNRPYGAIGFRASKKLDFELGYMRLFKRETDEDINRHIMQVMISTSL
ncbi:MAG: DUF2490 domain-containing protein [Pedobacter sp.]|nr:MAG: DUF2490 domain-containing protein [Pedobacter sp.]